MKAASGFPFLLRWPARVKARTEERIAAHIDVLPTLAEAAGVPLPAGRQIDGVSLLPRLLLPEEDVPERTLFIQSHRGNEPALYRNFAAITQRYKLVQPLSFGKAMPPNAPLELYDMESDSGEKRNLAGSQAAVVSRLQREYEQWFEDVSSTRGYEPPRISLGTEHEDPVILTRQDWRVERNDGWSDRHLGFWEVEVAAGRQLRSPAPFWSARDGRRRRVSAGIQQADQVIHARRGIADLHWNRPRSRPQPGCEPVSSGTEKPSASAMRTLRNWTEPDFGRAPAPSPSTVLPQPFLPRGVYSHRIRHDRKRRLFSAFVSTPRRWRVRTCLAAPREGISMFESALNPHHAESRRPWAIVVSFLFQMLVILTAALLSLLSARTFPVQQWVSQWIAPPPRLGAPDAAQAVPGRARGLQARGLQPRRGSHAISNPGSGDLIG